MSDTITIAAPRYALIFALRVLRHEVSVLDAACADGGGLGGAALARRRVELTRARAAYEALTRALGNALIEGETT